MNSLALPKNELIADENLLSKGRRMLACDGSFLWIHRRASSVDARRALLQTSCACDRLIISLRACDVRISRRLNVSFGADIDADAAGQVGAALFEERAIVVRVAHTIRCDRRVERLFFLFTRTGDDRRRRTAA